MPKFTVSRSIHIEADPMAVYERVIDFHTWPKWSPWLLCEKDCKLTFSDEADAVGGNFSWDGKVVGAGRMTHLSLNPPLDDSGSIQDELQFTRPWKSESKVSFQIERSSGRSGGDGTRLVWEMNGSLPAMMFWMKGMMVSKIGMDYDRGLTMLKEWIESGHIRSETDVIGFTQIGPRRVVGLSAKTKLADISASMESTIGDVSESLKRAGVESSGPWISIYDNLNFRSQEVCYTTGMALSESTPVPQGLKTTPIPATQALQVTHTGDYSHLGNAWAAAYQNLQASKRKASKIPGFEIYENGPHDTEPQDLVTQVYLPVK